MRRTISALVVAAATCLPATVLAQRLPFERTFELSEAAVLDVSTIRGKIDVRAGAPGRIVIAGTVTIRTAWDVPANAAELASRVVAAPPIERAGATIRLRPPADAATRRAVTISYEVRVPPETRVVAASESGATTIHGISGAVTVRTQSAAIELTQLGAAAGVTTGSGAVTVDDVAGALTVTTSSSAFSGRSLRGSLRVRTSSGAVDATLAAAGDVDVETGSSAIRLRGVSGALTATSRSGRISIQGSPGHGWDLTTGSGQVALALDPQRPFAVNATSHSGTVTLTGASVRGTVSKHQMVGTVGGDGPPVHISSRSGSIDITLARR
jgi:hypothetical protein